MKATGHASTPEVESGVKGEGTLRISPNALRVLKKRYLAKDENGKVIEAPEGMFRRVAHNLAQADAFYGATPEEVRAAEEEFYAMMARLDFLPNSPTLMNAGRPLQQLAACFVLPVDDSDRKSTRLNSSHDQISYAVFCLKKKKIYNDYVK